MRSLPTSSIRSTFLVTFTLCLIGAFGVADGQPPSPSEVPRSSHPDRISVQLEPAPKDWADHAKTVAEVLAPLTTAFFGIWILLITKRLERSQWHGQKLIEKRIEVWDKVGPDINDIFVTAPGLAGGKSLRLQKLFRRSATLINGFI